MLDSLCRLPRNLEVIVGAPRSGMLVANLLALHLNLPMTDIEGLLGSRLITARHGQAGEIPPPDRASSTWHRPRGGQVEDDRCLIGTPSIPGSAAPSGAALVSQCPDTPLPGTEALPPGVPFQGPPR
jgi:hypothetical protein